MRAMRGVQRRTLLAACAGLVAGCGDGSGGRNGSASRLLSGSEQEGPSSDASSQPGRRGSASFASTYRRATVGYQWCLPTETSRPQGLPVVIALHGFGGDARWMMDLGFPALLDGVIRDGARPFAFVTVDGGHSSYYHPRSDGTDAGAMIMLELLPRLKESGFDTGRLALCGFSMGGYGALRLAAAYRSDVRAAAAAAPAVWLRAQDAAPVAFDSPDDWRTHGLMSNPSVLEGIPLRIDCGTGDPFAQAVRVLRSRLRPVPAGGMSPGAHTAHYVREHLPAQLRFLADHLG